MCVQIALNLLPIFSGSEPYFTVRNYLLASSTATGRLKKPFINAVLFSVVYYECISYEGAWRLCVIVAVKKGV